MMMMIIQGHRSFADHLVR